MKRLNRRWWIAGTLVLLFFGTLFSYAYFRLLQLNGNLNTVIAETTIFGMCAGSVFLARKRPRYFLLFASMAALGGFWRSFQGNIEYQDRAQAQSDFYRSTKKIVDDLQSRVELRMKGAPDRVLSLNRASFFGVPEEAPPGRRHFHWMEVGRWETLSGNISGFLNIPSVQGHYSLEIASRMRLIEYFYSRERHSDLFNLMGARYLLTRDGAKPLEVRVNLDALENFRSFDQFTVANQENELALVAANRDFTKNLVLLNGPSEEALVPVKKTAAKLSFQNSQSSTFSVASEEAGTVLFLVNSTWAPGWKAFASGNELPIFRANGWSKAVFLKFDQPGTKAVEFKYQEGGFAPGLVLFAFWLVLSSALWRRRFVGAIQ